MTQRYRSHVRTNIEMTILLAIVSAREWDRQYEMIQMLGGSCELIWANQKAITSLVVAASPIHVRAECLAKPKLKSEAVNQILVLKSW